MFLLKSSWCLCYFLIKMHNSLFLDNFICIMVLNNVFKCFIIVHIFVVFILVSIFTFVNCFHMTPIELCGVP